MSKVLAVINDEDKDKGVAVSSLLSTYMTILQIEGYDIDRSKIRKRIIEVQDEMMLFWSYLSEKYMFPLYLDKTIRINYENNTVYMDF